MAKRQSAWKQIACKQIACKQIACQCSANQGHSPPPPSTFAIRRRRMAIAGWRGSGWSERSLVRADTQRPLPLPRAPPGGWENAPASSRFTQWMRALAGQMKAVTAVESLSGVAQQSHSHSECSDCSGVAQRLGGFIRPGEWQECSRRLCLWQMQRGEAKASL